jgi:hypothetical protein
MGDQVLQHVEGFRRQGKGLRPTPETGVVRIKPKVGKAPLGEDIHDLLFFHWGVDHVSEVSKRMIPQPPYAGIEQRARLLPKHYSLFTRLLRYLYDFPRPICHTFQRRGEQRLVSHAHDVMSGTGLRGQRVACSQRAVFFLWARHRAHRGNRGAGTAQPRRRPP